MAETAIRRKRALWFFVVLALTGGVLQLFSKPHSVAWDLGAILLLACFVSASYFFMWFAKKRRVEFLPLQFDAAQPFVPHVLVDLILNDERSGGADRPEVLRRVFVVGAQGFTARFTVPAGSRVPLRVEAQFLRPEVALPHFAAGGAFAVIDKTRTVGTGTVVTVLSAPSGGAS